jgi:DNA-binding response OmpR family regulator
LDETELVEKRMNTILVIEDELSIRTFVSLNLRKKNYQVIEADNGEEALRIIKSNKIDIVLLDISLPGIDGYQVCQEIRSLGLSTGIIMLTARSQEEDKIKGLAQGADDYLTKPFSLAELEVRIISLLRRMNYYSSTRNMSILSSGPFQLDLTNKNMSMMGKEIKLTPTEYCLLQFLITNKEQVYSRNDLLDEIWGVNYIGDIKVIDVNIRRIRSKIEIDPSNPKYLITVWGHGYMWKE